MAFILTITSCGTVTPCVRAAHDTAESAIAEVRKFAGTAYRVNGVDAGTLSTPLRFDKPDGTHQASYTFNIREV